MDTKLDGLLPGLERAPPETTSVAAAALAASSPTSAAGAATVATAAVASEPQGTARAATGTGARVAVRSAADTPSQKGEERRSSAGPHGDDATNAAAAPDATDAAGALRRRAVGLLEAGQWGRCGELLEAAVFGAERAPRIRDSGGNARGGRAGTGALPSGAPAAAAGAAAGATARAAGGAAAGAAPRGAKSTAVVRDKALLQMLLVAKLNAEAAAADLARPPAANCALAAGRSGGGVAQYPGVVAGAAAPAPGATLQWAAIRLTEDAPSGPSDAAAAATEPGGGAAAASAAASALSRTAFILPPSAPAAAAVLTGAPTPPREEKDVAGHVLRSRREVRTWFRRLAALVHPDKCRTVVPEAAAAAAFRQLRAGAEALLKGLAGVPPSNDGGAAGADEGGAGVGLKRRRRSDYCHGSGRNDYDDNDRVQSFDGDDDGGGGYGADDGGGDGESDPWDGDAWWTEWCGGDGAPPQPTTCPSAEDDEPALWGLPLEELEAEVAARQAAVLRPPPGSEAAALGVHARQRRLRVARGVLSERLAGGAAAGFAGVAAAAAGGGGVGEGGGGGSGVGGGFVPEGHWGGGGFAGGFM